MKEQHTNDEAAAAAGPAMQAPVPAPREERTEEQYHALVHRLNRIEGQINGLRGLLDRSLRCGDILVQTSAIVAALHGFERELVLQNLVGSVAKDLRAGRGEAATEFADCLRRSMH